MNLVIDSGNTLLKAAIFDGKNLIGYKADITINDLKDLASSHNISNVIISSVSKYDFVNDGFFSQFGNVIYFNHTTPSAINNLYHTPHTLGMDRLAGAAGSIGLYPNQNNLVIDAGSCITYDIIDKYNNYHGGNITPGLNMKLKALNTFTARLPLLELADQKNIIGTDTSTSIMSGIVFGTVSEIEGFIKLYKEKFSPLNIIICGGDAGFFESKIKEHIFVVPQLVLIGLNSILEYNVSKK